MYVWVELLDSEQSVLPKYKVVTIDSSKFRALE
jgi:hypothetical protein